MTSQPFRATGGHTAKSPNRRTWPTAETHNGVGPRTESGGSSLRRSGPAGARLNQAFQRLLTVIAIGASFLTPRFVMAESFVPRDGNQVLERLRSTPLSSSTRNLRALRSRLVEDPQNLDLAAQYARQCIELSRTEADPRFLGRAQCALAPWWQDPSAPAQALVLRATIRQSQHDFTNALRDLDLALTKAPRDPQVWLTRATILTVLGDYSAARRACLPLAQLAPGLVALTAAAEVACLTGDAERGCQLLRNSLRTTAAAGTAERIWSLTILAEAQARLGHNAEAENTFKTALELQPHDPYLLSAYSDLLLDLGRPQEVVALLHGSVRSDALLLHLAIAESRLNRPTSDLNVHLSMLRTRFEAGHLRGDFVHQREEARFELALLGNSHEALNLAKANWQIQHEPADARILLESAAAVNDPSAAEPVLTFIKATGLQDTRLTALLKKLQNSKAS